jgi:hypothetical protein
VSLLSPPSPQYWGSGATHTHTHAGTCRRGWGGPSCSRCLLHLLQSSARPAAGWSWPHCRPQPHSAGCPQVQPTAEWRCSSGPQCQPGSALPEPVSSCQVCQVKNGLGGLVSAVAVQHDRPTCTATPGRPRRLSQAIQPATGTADEERWLPPGVTGLAPATRQNTPSSGPPPHLRSQQQLPTEADFTVTKPWVDAMPH